MIKKQAFTLVETLLYISLVAILLTSLVGFVSILQRSREKNQTVTEVEQQGQAIMEIITQTIRNSDSINSPAAGTSAASISLNVYDAADDPTLFALSGSNITIKEGAAATINLNSDKVIVSGLTFRNLSRPGTSGVIRIEFTISHVNPDNVNEYDYSVNFYDSAAIK